jgi:hypothetical protein
MPPAGKSCGQASLQLHPVARATPSFAPQRPVTPPATLVVVHAASHPSRASPRLSPANGPISMGWPSKAHRPWPLSGGGRDHRGLPTPWLLLQKTANRLDTFGIFSLTGSGGFSSPCAFCQSGPVKSRGLCHAGGSWQGPPSTDSSSARGIWGGTTKIGDELDPVRAIILVPYQAYQREELLIGTCDWCHLSRPNIRCVFVRLSSLVQYQFPPLTIPGDISPVRMLFSTQRLHPQLSVASGLHLSSRSIQKSAIFLSA